MRARDLVLSLLTTMAAGHAVAVECFANCAIGAPCEVNAPRGTTVLDGKKPQEISMCDDAKLTAGKLLRIVIGSLNGPQTFSIAEKDKGRRFAELAPKQFEKPACLGLTPSCAEARAEKISKIGAKGIDEPDEGKPSGSPCEWGMPCGDILMPHGTLTFKLLLPAQDARWTIHPIRPTGPDVTVPAKNGSIDLPGTALIPGRSFAYRLIERDGKVLCSGSFSVMSTQQQRDVEADVPSGADQTFDAVVELLRNGLWWDAMRRNQ